MIICSCHGITDHQIRDCATQSDCAQTPMDIYRGLGREPGCGVCARTIGNILTEMGVAKKAGKSCGKCPVRAQVEASKARVAANTQEYYPLAAE